MRLLAAVLLLSWASASPAQAQGISARFGNLVATLGEDFSASIEISDPIDVVHRVVLEVRPRGDAAWRRTDAVRTRASWWEGTFTSTSIWTSREEPEVLELRAKVFGERGGLLLDLGGIEPLEVQVLTKPEVEARERAFRVYRAGGPEPERDDLFWLTGYVGTEGRAHSGARARFLIGAGGAITDLVELIFYFSVGPAFSRPVELAGGGPIVLGIESAVRIFTRPPSLHDLALFVEPNLQVDLRFPGVDPGAGLRGGLSYRASGELAVELALGGAALWLRAIDEDIDSELGFAGTLRLALRFGGPKLVEAAP